MKRYVSKFISLFLALSLILSFSATTFAEEATKAAATPNSASTSSNTPSYDDFLKFLAEAQQKAEDDKGSALTGDEAVKLFYEVLKTYLDVSNDEDVTEQELLEGLVYNLLMNYPDMMPAFVNMMLQSHNQFNAYLTAEEWDSFINQKSLTGLGIKYLYQDGIAKVIRVYDNTPAAKAGICEGDIFYTINGQRLYGNGDPSSILAAAGDKNITASLYRPSDHILYTTKLSKEAFTANVVFWEKHTDGKVPYAVVRIDDFMGTIEEYNAAIDDIYNSGIKRIVFDLRDNPGGELENAAAYIDKLIPTKGKLLFKTNFKKGVDVDTSYYSTGIGKAFDKVAILINKNSYSAAEVMTISLRELLGAQIIGQTSYGKGVGMQGFPMSDNSVLLAVDFEITSPKGNHYNGVGIVPDQVITNPDPTYPGYQFKPLNHDNYTSVKEGLLSDTVIALEQRLKIVGVLDSVDNLFDDKTTEAIKKFQTNAGIPVTGVLDLQTFNMLTDVVNLAKNISTQQDAQMEYALKYIQE
ncbi:MAG: S41 family peptidase [Bacillota bacterium]|nr:S41 family peptidase [Bacillota bacterium]